MLSVERFLQAANIRDFEAMARIFGTADGPIIEDTGGGFSCAFRRMGSWIGLGDRCVSWIEIELRMDAISQILRHQDYRIRSESSVAGRTRPTTRIGVDIERGGILYPDVPFFVVQASDGRWLIEQVDLARMTVLREPDQLLRDMSKIAHLPGVIVHGRYDVICPLDNAWALHQAWPNSELQIIRDAGHSAAETGITDALVRAADELAHRLLNLAPDEA
jgi:pimeloyl-ACP methyl ester carboxylesterase